jgi:hypothetical protein
MNKKVTLIFSEAEHRNHEVVEVRLDGSDEARVSAGGHVWEPRTVVVPRELWPVEHTAEAWAEAVRLAERRLL